MLAPSFIVILMDLLLPVPACSGNVMDRASIIQHLLNDETDPFNRHPLKPEDLIPQPELKTKIDAYMEAKRAGKK